MTQIISFQEREESGCNFRLEQPMIFKNVTCITQSEYSQIFSGEFRVQEGRSDQDREMVGSLSWPVPSSLRGQRESYRGPRVRAHKGKFIECTFPSHELWGCHEHL